MVVGMTEPIAVPAKTIRSSISEGTLTLSGRLLIDTLLQLKGSTAGTTLETVHCIDITDLSQMDTAGAWFLLDQYFTRDQRRVA